ncbi:hypothetical protein GCM10022291_15740 [Postechiella marina]|uniref:Outer membrane protein n=1 Tax=Postechiella marina TaxID=943941 RepID=A0ABP8C796_9FLAO
MLKFCSVLLFFTLVSGTINAQYNTNKYFETQKDSTKKSNFIKHLANGYLPTKYFNFDLRYLVKYNQYEALRTGFGGETTKAFAKNFRVTGYGVYGFGDSRFKYNVAGGYRLAKKTKTWINLSYTDDLQETGSSKFLTDKRFFQFFEPRLLNIDLFHKHITKALSLEHQLAPKILTESEFALSNISSTYNYKYQLGANSFETYRLTTAKFALQWSPFSTYNYNEKDELKETVAAYPKITVQYSKSFKNIAKSNFNFSKLDIKAIHKIFHKNESESEFILVSGLSNGDIPLTHLYHAYPNNINKQTVMQRFSVAGINSFETMFFNEFFSDKFTTIQFKHTFKPFNISVWFKPQMALISRYAVGSINNIERHQNISFGSLNKGYTESGIELNKLFFGFGLSFTYRYGAYHLPQVQDNIALKFTFNLTL